MDEQTTALVKYNPSTTSEVINLSDYATMEPPPQLNLQFMSDAALKQGTHVVAGVGVGKSRGLGRIFAWQQLIRGKPAVILDPTGSVTDNLFAKILRLSPADQEQLWPRILYCCPGSKQYVVPTPLYYQVNANESLAESASRLPYVFKIQDPALSSAPILGLNPLVECATHAGKIAKAKNRQLDFVADLVEHPGRYKELLREVLMEFPDLRGSIEYFRSLMDPSSGSLREKKTGSFKTKLLAFTTDPTRMATYAAKSNLLDWAKLFTHRMVVVIDYREQLNPDYLQFDMIWHLKTFIDAIKQRAMAGRGEEVLLIIDEITAMLRHHTQDGHAILAEDLQELISRLGRNYGVNTVIAHQGLYQLDKEIQELLMGMGNQIIGQLTNPDDAVRVAKQFMRYDPYKLKKTENVWGTIHPPAILSYFGGPAYPYPRVIDERTVEFTPEEQLLDWVNIILDLDRFQFLTQIATGEGGKKYPVSKITIENLDKNHYPNEAILTHLRQALLKRNGIPVEKLLGEIQANHIEAQSEKKSKSPRQPTKEPATMENDHDNHTNPTPTPSHSREPIADSGHLTTGDLPKPTPDFWEPSSPTNDSANTS